MENKDDYEKGILHYFYYLGAANALLANEGKKDALDFESRYNEFKKIQDENR